MRSTGTLRQEEQKLEELQRSPWFGSGAAIPPAAMALVRHTRPGPIETGAQELDFLALAERLAVR